MSEPDEIKEPDATQPTTQPGDESDSGYLTGSHSADPADVEDVSRLRSALTTSTKTHTTTTDATSSHSAPVVTASRPTSKTKRLALRTALMKQHGIVERTDRTTGQRYFMCRGEYTQELLQELRRLEN